MRAFRLILPLLSLSALAGCSIALPDSLHRTPYEAAPAPEVSPERAERDLESCRRWAEHAMGPEAAIDPSEEHTTNPMVLARREQVRGSFQALVDQCMGVSR